VIGEDEEEEEDHQVNETGSRHDHSPDSMRSEDSQDMWNELAAMQ